MPFQTIVVDFGNPATLLLADQESGTLVNLDPSNTLTIGDNDSIQPGDPETAPIGPGMAVPFDNGPVYGISPNSNLTMTVIKLPYASSYAISSNAPAATPPKVTSLSLGSGASQTLIPTPGAGYQIQLISLLLTSVAITPAGGIANSFTVEDTVTDTDGTQYLACEIGLPGGNVNFGLVNSAPLPMNQAGPPPNHRLILNNGGAGGSTALRRCSATAVYYIVGIGL